MEKSAPHTALEDVWRLLDEGKVRETFSALSGAAALGMSRSDMHDVVRALSLKDFFKSMTAYHDENVWHDVYKPVTPFGHLYVKLIVSNNVLIVSFKEK